MTPVVLLLESLFLEINDPCLPDYTLGIIIPRDNDSCLPDSTLRVIIKLPGSTLRIIIPRDK